jgi:hypothetical protein
MTDRTFTTLYGPGESLAEWRLVSVERDGLKFCRWAKASRTVH